MDTTWPTALWRQFGAAIDVLEDALLTCPDALWKERLWPIPVDHSNSPVFAEFWYIVYHTLFWLDLYLSGSREEDFTPPAPFIWTETDPDWLLPERPYTKEELHTYLVALRRRSYTTLSELTDERAQQIVVYPWTEGKAVSFLELQLYLMRHVQDHAAQLHLFLGQRDISALSNAVARAQDHPDDYQGTTAG